MANYTNYFSHDSNARNSDKLIKVRMSLGAEGYGIYFMILERLREERNYMSVKDYNMVAFDLRVDTSKVKQVIEDFGLFAFTDDGECFYSESFLRRMKIKDEKSEKRSKAGKKGADARWKKQDDSNDIDEESGTNGNAMAMPLKNMPSKEKESKVNERKDNDIDNTSSTSFNKKIIQEWNLIDTIPNLQALNTGTKRYELLKARRKQYGDEAVFKAIENINKSDFLQGKVSDFSITFDWFVKPNNFIKVLEGNYDNKEKSNYNNQKNNNRTKYYKPESNQNNSKENDSIRKMLAERAMKELNERMLDYRVGEGKELFERLSEENQYIYKITYDKYEKEAVGG